MGVLTLNPDGTVTGKQSATLTPLTGAGQELKHRELELTGTYSNSGVWGSSKLIFVTIDETEVGTFDIIHVDPNQFWMISTGAHMLPGNSPADEVNSGEAVRIRPLS